MNQYSPATPSSKTDLGAAASDLTHKVSKAVQDAPAAASSMAGDLKRKAMDSLEAGSHMVADATESVKTSLSDMASSASRGLKESIEEQKTAGAGAIADLAKSARETADGFSSQAPQIADAVKTVATKIEQVSNDMKEKSVNEMMESVTAFAHRQPLAFLGCGIIAGLVLSRLLSGPSRS